MADKGREVGVYRRRGNDEYQSPEKSAGIENVTDSIQRYETVLRHIAFSPSTLKPNIMRCPCQRFSALLGPGLVPAHCS